MRRFALLVSSLALLGLLSSCCCPSDESGSTNEQGSDVDAKPPKASKKGKKKAKAKRAYVTKHLKRLRKSSVCKKKKGRFAPVCKVAKGFAKAKLTEAPIDRSARLGFTIFVPTDGDVKAAALKTAHVSALGFSKKGNDYKAIVIGISQKNAAQKAHAAALLDDVLASMKGKKRRLEPEANFYDYAQSLPMRADMDCFVHDRGFFWEFERGSFGDVRKVGDWWVVVEAPRDPIGVYVSVFTNESFERGEGVMP